MCICVFITELTETVCRVTQLSVNVTCPPTAKAYVMDVSAQREDVVNNLCHLNNAHTSVMTAQSFS